MEKRLNLEITVVFSDDGFIKLLNKRYRQKASATDVLSFGQKASLPGQSVKILGDIVISVDAAKKQAKEYGNSIKKEIVILIIHGFYHILGYDHYRKNDYKSMKKKENKALSLIENKIGF